MDVEDGRGRWIWMMDVDGGCGSWKVNVNGDWRLLVVGRGEWVGEWR